MDSMKEGFLKLATGFSGAGCSVAEMVEAITACWSRLSGNSDEIGKAMRENYNRLAGASTTEPKGDLENFEPKIEKINLSLDNYNIEIEEFKDWMIEI